MGFFGTRLFARIIFSVLAIAPMIFWVFLLDVAESSYVKLRTVLRWIRMLRWVAWSGSIVLFIVYVIVDHVQHFPIYAIALSTFSAGLAGLEGWLKRKLVRAG